MTSQLSNLQGRLDKRWKADDSVIPQFGAGFYLSHQI